MKQHPSLDLKDLDAFAERLASSLRGGHGDVNEPREVVPA